MPEKKLYADRKSPQKVKFIIGQINICSCTNTNSKLEDLIHVLRVQRILKLANFIHNTSVNEVTITDIN